jgi:flagellum-specific ATP synthase
MRVDLRSKLDRVKQIEPLRIYGHITKIIGLTIESDGPPACVGEVLHVDIDQNPVPLQVVGFNGKKVLSMPFGNISGITNGHPVYASGKTPGFNFDERFLGRVLNGLAVPIDGLPLINGVHYVHVYRDAVNAMKRKPITDPIATGVKAIDAMITIGKGQRMGIFSGSGVGKSTLMGMIARNTSADINVIALIGERGRELKDFIENSLGSDGLKRSVVVAATSDEPPLIKIIAAFTATAIAEYFSDRGANVMLMMDSITRFAMAQREIGLSVGEPPSSKGYTPSVFALLPKLLERAGNFSEKGSITGIYTVLVEGDDVTEPISDHARSILDGHIVLSRNIAHKNHFPSIDVLESISRLMKDITDESQQVLAGKMRELLAVYRDAEDLINIGAYAKGSNQKIDSAIAKIDKINEFLKQKVAESFTLEQTNLLLSGIMK